jgi:hypothetical protein
VAAADGELTNGWAGSPLVTAAAGVTFFEAVPSSRREAANGVVTDASAGAGEELSDGAEACAVEACATVGTAPTGVATTTEGAGAELRRRGVLAAGDGVRVPPRTCVESLFEDSAFEDSEFEDSEFEDTDGVPLVRLPRPVRRAGAFWVDESADVEEPGELVPLEPDEPVVSANAIGMAAMPEPTPSAIASAPTRPT